jgi:hypothetical protein
MTWQRVKIEIPDNLGPKDRESLGFAILEHIRERTQSGTGLNSAGNRLKDFPAYSKGYMKSLDFKIAGKSSKVDLTLSGDMLDAMDLLKHKKGELTIGFENGSVDNAKAEGNILGSYGGSPNARKARNFLGVTRSELKAIVGDFTNG